MNTRLWLVTLGCFSALILIGVGHEYLRDETTVPKVTAKLPTPPSLTKPIEGTSPVGRGNEQAKEEQTLSRKEQFQKLLELAQTGPVTVELPEAMRRTGGKKAIEPLVSLMRSTDDFKIVDACAVALQDYQDPALLHDVLTRLDEIGVLGDPGKLPWFSKKLFGEYAKTTQEPLLVLKVIRTRPALYEQGAALVTASLQSPEAETKKLAEEIQSKVATAKGPATTPVQK